MNKRKCQYRNCDEDVPVWRNGNSRYCCDEHQYEERLLRQADKYASARGADQYRKQNEAILAYYYKRFGSDQYIPVQLLDKDGFDFSLCDGKIEIEEYRASILGQHAIVFFNDKTVRIWTVK